MTRLLSQVGEAVHREWQSSDFSRGSFFSAIERGMQFGFPFRNEIILSAREHILRGQAEIYHSPHDRFSVEVQFMPEPFRTGIWESAADLFTYPLTGKLLHVHYQFVPTFSDPALKWGNLKSTEPEIIRPGDLREWTAGLLRETFQITPGTITLNFYFGKKYPAPETQYYRPGLALLRRDPPDFYKRRQILLFLQRVDPNWNDKVPTWIKKGQPNEALRHLIRLLETRPFSPFTETYRREVLTLFAGNPVLKNNTESLSEILRNRWSGLPIRDSGARLFMALFETFGFGESLLRTLKTVYPDVDLSRQILNWVKHIVLREKRDARFLSNLLLQTRELQTRPQASL